MSTRSSMGGTMSAVGTSTSSTSLSVIYGGSNSATVIATEVTARIAARARYGRM